MDKSKTRHYPRWALSFIVALLVMVAIWWRSSVLGALLLAPWPLRARVQTRDAYDYLDFINPLVGTTGGGHVFAGSSTPFASVKVGADSKSSIDSQPGFVDNDTPLYGFSQLHDDGTGGSSSLGQFAFLPDICSYEETKKGGSQACQLMRESRALNQVSKSARATPGLFSIGLENGINVRLTSTDHVALHSYKLSDGISGPSQSLSLLFDLTSDLQLSYTGRAQMAIELDQATSRATIRGSGQFAPSFGSGTFGVHFCATVPHVIRAGTVSNATLRDGKRLLKDPPSDSGALFEIDTAALASFTNNTLYVRIGVSWKDQDQACQYQKTEMPFFGNETAFKSVVSSNRAKWSAFLGGNLQVGGIDHVSEDQRINFFTSLYRTGLSPTNITGDNPLWKSSEPYWDSFYCIWDSFRTTSPLTAILQPQALAEQVRSLIDTYRHLGFLPDCRMSLCKGLTQGGSNADTLLADAYVKGIRKGINWTDGLLAMRKDAEESPPDWGLEGRGGIEARRRLGFVPIDGGGNEPSGSRVVPGRTASRTIEYAYNDFGIALVAAGLGQQKVYEQYLNASGDWFNVWDAKRSFSTGKANFTGFINSRRADGHFSYKEDVRRCSPSFQFGKCYLMFVDSDAQFYEGSSYQYSFYVPHDMYRLVKLMGGDEAFIQRLETGWENNYNDVGDEMGFLPNFQHNYAVGGYRHAVDRSLKTLREHFRPTSDGLPGNDDSGAMSAYVVFTGLGMYPVAGTSVYLLTTPLFPSFRIKSQVTGKTASVTTEGWDEAKENKYIISASLNGQKITRNWITHQEFFLDGGSLHLILGSSPSGFGERTDDLPPSLSSGAFRYETAGQGI